MVTRIVLDLRHRKTNSIYSNVAEIPKGPTHMNNLSVYDWGKNTSCHFLVGQPAELIAD